MAEINRLFGTPASEAKPATETDQLEYIADLIGELEALAAHASGSELLKGLLALAHDEARRLATATRTDPGSNERG